MSSSVRIAINSVPTWGCMGEITSMPGSLTLVTVIVSSISPRSSPAYSSAGIIGWLSGCAVLAAGAEPHSDLVDVVSLALSKYRRGHA